MAEKVYTPEEIEAKLKELDGWYFEGGWIKKKYNTEGWPTTLMLINAIGFLCEPANHHPDLEVTYAKLWVKLVTHSAKGVTDKDFALAKKIDEVVLWRPGADSPFDHASTGKFVYVKK